jgi:hypothetical protein
MSGRTTSDLKGEQIGEVVEPAAGPLSESLRDFGYSLPSALADLIDNSLTAGATKIQVLLHAEGGKSWIAVLDDGRGMPERQLVDAMRMGTKGPLVPRESSDLGRFGLGMKTASMSLGRSLTVATKPGPGANVFARRWDLDFVSRTGWLLLRSCSPTAAEVMRGLSDWATGTAVIIEHLDRVGFAAASGHEANKRLAQSLDEVRQRLSMTFHGFVCNGVVIRLGQTPLSPWDPFMQGVSTPLAPETIPYPGGNIRVAPYLLPHHSRLTDDQHRAAAGPNGWNAHQGFYIYRNNRLVVPGSWLDLGIKKEEHYKLARIRVDLPNSLDKDWQLNVMKSRVAIPSGLRADFRRIADDVRRQAADVYRYRGERQLPVIAEPERYVWRRTETAHGVRYAIDRTHPIIQALLQAKCGHEDVLKEVLILIEQSLPVSTILAEPPKALEGMVVEYEDDALAELVKTVRFVEQHYVRHGHTPAEAREKILQAEPFARCRERLVAALARKG